jgi:cytoskeletal protein CcmA (bactofilin family)
VDAAQIFAILCAIPPEQADFFHTITTAGNSKTPTCSVYQHKLSRVDQPKTRALRSLPGEMIFQSTPVVPDPVACGRLEIMPECEVTFPHEIRTQYLIVRGHVSGDFICQGSVTLEPGSVTLEPGSTLKGSVAARSITVQNGAELRGQFRIVEDVTEAIAPNSTTWFWRCQNDSAKDACRSVVFQPHG